MQDLLPFFKFGGEEEYTLSSGIKSNYYVDLRGLQSHPHLMMKICKTISQTLDIPPDSRDEFLICGVPTAGVPYATLVSQICNIPMITLRKEPKKYGTKRMIEGDITSKNKCVILIEDVTTTGNSLISARNIILDHGFDRALCVVVYDRGCGDNIVPNMISLYNHTHLDRIQRLPKYLVHIRNMKNTRLVYSFDKDDDAGLSRLHKLAPYICGVKLHSDMLTYDYETMIRMSYEFYFIIIEDRKLADISKTNHHIMNKMYWADAVTIHAISGLSNMIPSSKMLLPIAQMSSSDHMITPDYTESVISFARSHPSHVLGVIGQDTWDGVMTFTPGVRGVSSGTSDGNHWGCRDNVKSWPLEAAAVPQRHSVSGTSSSDGNQTYRHPKDVKSDFIIVGSALHDADVETIKEYML